MIKNKIKIIPTATFLTLFFAIVLLLSIKTPSNPLAPASPNQALVLGLNTEKPRDELQKPTPPFKNLPENKLLEQTIVAKAYLVLDTNSNTILFSKGENLRLPIASLTKLLTAVVAYEELDVMSEVELPEVGEVKSISPSLGLTVGDEIKVIDLINSTLVCSTNDSAKALSLLVENISGKNFVELMNKKAKELDLNNSKFSNAMGFDSFDNYSNASDLLKLAVYTQKLSVFKNLGKKALIKFEGKNKTYSCKASNKLVSPDSIFENIKTGHTLHAQGNLAVKAKMGKKEILIVLLGSKQRETDVKILADIAFNQFIWP